MNKGIVIATSICVLVVGVVLAAKLNDAGKTNKQLTAEIGQLKDRIAVLESQLKTSHRSKHHAHQSDVMPPVFSNNHYDVFDPFGVFNNIHQHMSQMMDDSFYGPQMDIQEKNNQYVITLDIPGMQKENIKVEVQHGALVVSGTRDDKKEEQDDKNHFYRQERSFGRFMRTVPLPEDAKVDDVNAEYKEGVLIVTVGKNKPADTQQQSNQIIVK